MLRRNLPVEPGQGALVKLQDFRPRHAPAPLQEKEWAQTAKEPGRPVKPAAYGTAAAAEFRAALMAQGIPVHQLDDGTQSSNVIDGPFKKRGVDDTDDA